MYLHDGKYLPNQFGNAFALPAEIVQAVHDDRIVDQSWGNDAMACFMLPDRSDDTDPVLWVDTVDTDASEYNDREGRYVVFASHTPSDASDVYNLRYIGDDVQKALDALYLAGDDMPHTREPFAG